MEFSTNWFKEICMVFNGIEGFGLSDRRFVAYLTKLSQEQK